MVLAAIALDTKVVRIGSSADVSQEAFSPDLFRRKANSRAYRRFVVEHAVNAATFGPAVMADNESRPPSNTGQPHRPVRSSRSG
ncbi:hypothetical protein ACVOMV_19600 [Mesorhizobium atlanticum]